MIVPDPMNPNFFQVVRNLEWTNIPEVCSFTDFIRWNYAEDYERVFRKCIEGAMLSDKTISRMRSAKKKMPEIKSIVAVSIGMNLYPALSMDLLEKADRRFDPEVPEHKWYRAILTTMYRSPITAINELLESRGFEPLKEDKLAAAAGE